MADAAKGNHMLLTGDASSGSSRIYTAKMSDLNNTQLVATSGRFAYESGVNCSVDENSNRDNNAVANNFDINDEKQWVFPKVVSFEFSEENKVPEPEPSAKVSVEEQIQLDLSYKLSVHAKARKVRYDIIARDEWTADDCVQYAIHSPDASFPNTESTQKISDACRRLLMHISTKAHNGIDYAKQEQEFRNLFKYSLHKQLPDELKNDAIAAMKEDFMNASFNFGSFGPMANSRTRGYVLPIFDDAKDEGLMKIFNDYEDHVDFIKRSILLIRQLWRSTDFLDTYSCVYQFLSAHSSSIVDKTLGSMLASAIHSGICAMRTSKPKSEAWSDAVLSASGLLQQVMEAPIVASIRNLLVTAASFKFFSKDVAFKIFDYFEKPKDMNVISLIGLSMKSIASLLKVGEAIIAGMPVSDALFAEDPVRFAITKAKNLVKMAPFTYSGLPVPGKVDIYDYYRESGEVLAILDRAAEQRFVFASQRAQIDEVRFALKVELEKKRAKLRGLARPTPIGVVIVGPPGIGKSGLLVLTSWIYSKVCGREYKPGHAYTRNVNSEYWEGYEPLSHDIVLYPEVGSHSKKLAEMGLEIAIPELLGVIDSQPFPCNMAKLEDKGVIYFSSGLVLIDTNVKDMNIAAIKRNPAAFYRRFIFVTPTVKEEYRVDGTGMLDADKCPDDVRYFDKWTFKVETMKANSNTSHTPVHHMDGGGVDEFYEVMSKLFRHKIQREQSVIESRQNFMHSDVYGQEHINMMQEIMDAEQKDIEEEKENKPECGNGIRLDFISMPISQQSVILSQAGDMDKDFDHLADTLDELKNDDPDFERVLDNAIDGRYVAPDDFDAHMIPSAKKVYRRLKYWRLRAEDCFSSFFYVSTTLLCVFWNYLKYVLCWTSWAFNDKTSGWLVDVTFTFWAKFLLSFVFFSYCGYWMPLVSAIISFVNYNSVVKRAKKKVAKEVGEAALKTAKEHWTRFKIYTGEAAISFATYENVGIAVAIASLAGSLFWIAPKICEAFIDDKWKIGEVDRRHRDNYREWCLEQAKLHTQTAEQVPKSESEFRQGDPSVNDRLVAIEQSHHQGKSYKRVLLKTSPLENPAWNMRAEEYPSLYTEQDPSNLVAKYAKNVYECMVDIGSSRRHSYAFGITGSIVVMNKHSFSGKKNVIVEVCSRPGMLKESDHFHKSEINCEKDLVDMGGDLVLLMLSSINVTDALPHILRSKTVRPGVCARIMDTDVRATQIKNITVTDKYVSDYTIEDAFMYTWNGHSDGKCGLPLFVQKDAGWSICGIHIAGHQDTDVSYASMLNYDRIVCGIAKLREQRGLMNPASQSRVFDQLTFEEPVPKSPFRYIWATGRYFGKDSETKIKVNQKSNVTQTPFGSTRFLDDLFLKECKFEPTVIYAPPVMTPYVDRTTGDYVSPYNIGLEKIFRQKAALNRDIIEEIVGEFGDHIVRELRKRGVPQLSPLDVETAINGAQEDAFIRRIDTARSAGFGWPGSKAQYLDVVMEDVRCLIREPCGDLKGVLVQGYSTYAEGICRGVVHKVQLKAEPRAIEKVRKGKTRLFFMTPLDNLIFTRQYLGPIFSLMVEHSDIFFCALGTNMHMDAWKLYDKLTQFSDKFMEGDYGNYDQCMPYDIAWGVSTMVFNILKEFGYNDEALKVVRGVLSDSMFPLVEVLGDVFESPGLQTSGKYATAEENSLRGMFLLIYAWKHLQREGKINHSWKFFDYLLPVVYGDDVIVSVKPLAQNVFNNVIYAKVVEKIFLMEYTSAAKGGDLQPLLLSHEMSFLKRKFVFNEHLQRIVAPLDMNSIFKTLQWYIPSKHVPREVQFESILLSTLYELWFAVPKDVFERLRTSLIHKLSYNVQLTREEIDSHMPTWEYLYGAFSFKPKSESGDTPLDSIEQQKQEFMAELQEAEKELEEYEDPYPGLSYHDVRMTPKWHLNSVFRSYYEKYITAKARVQDLRKSIECISKGQQARIARSAILSEAGDVSKLLELDGDFKLWEGQELVVVDTDTTWAEVFNFVKMNVSTANSWCDSFFKSYQMLPAYRKKMRKCNKYLKWMSGMKQHLVEAKIRLLTVHRVEDFIEMAKGLTEDLSFMMDGYYYEANLYFINLSRDESLIEFESDTPFEMVIAEDLSEQIERMGEEISNAWTHVLVQMSKSSVPKSESGEIGAQEKSMISPDEIVIRENIIDVEGEKESELPVGMVNAPRSMISTTLPIEEFFQRPLEMAAFTLTFGAHTNYTLNPWRDYFLNPTVRAKLRNYSMISCNMRITVKVSGTPFDYGTILITYVPHGVNNECVDWNTTNLATGQRTQVLKWLSGTRNCMVVDINRNKPVGVPIKYIGFQDVIRLYNGTAAVSDVTPFDDTLRLGTFYLVTLNVPSTLSTSPSPVSVYVQANLTDVVLGPTTGTNITIVAEAGEMLKAPIVSDSDVEEIKSCECMSVHCEAVSRALFDAYKCEHFMEKDHNFCQLIAFIRGLMFELERMHVERLRECHLAKSESGEMTKTATQKMATNASDFVGKFAGISTNIDPYVKASQMVLTAMGDAAAMIGWSCPPLIQDPTKMRPLLVENGANVIGKRFVRSLTLDPLQETTPKPQVAAQDHDELIITEITKLTGLLDITNWDDATVPLTPFWTVAVNPRILKPYIPVARTYCAPSPLCYAATPFSYWRGVIKFRFKIVCTVFHRGILGFLWDPNVAQSALILSSILTHKQHMIFIDIQQVQEITICVEWGFSRMWALMNDNTRMIGSVGTITTPLNHKDYANGFLSIFPINQLQTPDGNPIPIDVFVSSDDMQFNFLNQANLPTTRIMSEAGELPYESQDEVPCKSINSTCFGKSGLTLDFFGESPISFRGCMRRYVTEGRYTVATPAVAYYRFNLTASVMPPLEPRFNAVGVSTTDRCTLWCYFSYAFVAFKGSWCFRINGYNIAMSTSSVANVILNPPQSATGATTVTASLDGFSSQRLSGTIGFYGIGGGMDAIEFRMPWFSNNNFITPGNFTPFDTGDPQQITLGVRTYDLQMTGGVYAAAGANVGFVVNRCLGEDGTFSGWIAPPQFSF